MLSFDICECGAPLQRMERPTPKPEGTQVLLRMLAAGVCHSDLHLWEGFYDLGAGKKMQLTDRGVKLPLTLGHENVGEVIAVGPDVTGVRVGDRRLAYPWMGCGECAVCTRGEEQLCTKPRSLGVFYRGGYADHLLMPHPRYLFDIGTLQPSQAAPLACSGLTAYGALKKLGALIEREPIVIIGAGGLGLMCLALHKMLGGKAAIVVDLDPVKREAALKAGAVAAIDGGAADAVKQITAAAGGGVWGAIDFVGAGSTVRLGIDSLIKGGTLVVVGLFGGELTLSTLMISLKAMTLRGSYVGSPGELAELLALVRRAGAPPVPIETRPLAAVNDALLDLKAGKVIGRVVLTPS
jgi:D-arabinose 1-dehydrogenase-like Zn-dependent alcohol dehydrogenase